MTGAGGTLLVINAGSSSIKYQLFDVTTPDGLRLAFRGQLEGIGTKPHLTALDSTGATLADEAYPPGEVVDVGAALELIEAWLLGRLGSPPRAIGQRRHRSDVWCHGTARVARHDRSDTDAAGISCGHAATYRWCGECTNRHRGLRQGFRRSGRD